MDAISAVLRTSPFVQGKHVEALEEIDRSIEHARTKIPEESRRTRTLEKLRRIRDRVRGYCQ